MKSSTISFTDEQYERIEALSADNGEYSSKSEAVRSLLNRAFEHADLVEELSEKDERIETLQQRVEELNMKLADHNEVQAENQRLRNEKRTLVQERQDISDLAEWGETEKSLQERREQRRQEKEAAPIWKRVEWIIFGRK